MRAASVTLLLGLLATALPAPVPASGGGDLYEHGDPSPAPSGRYGRLADSTLHQYDPVTHTLTEVGVCGNECLEIGNGAGLQDGQCLHATDWRTLPPEHITTIYAQYLSYGACASVFTERLGGDVFRLYGRTQCKETEIPNIAADRREVDWYFLNGAGQVVDPGTHAWILGGGIGLVCPGWTFWRITFTEPGANALCARVRILHDGVLYRDTQHMCASTVQM